MEASVAGRGFEYTFRECLRNQEVIEGWGWCSADNEPGVVVELVPLGVAMMPRPRTSAMLMA